MSVVYKARDKVAASHNAADYYKFENDVWRPMAEQWIKEGSQSAWLFSTVLFPRNRSEVRRTERGYHGLASPPPVYFSEKGRPTS